MSTITAEQEQAIADLLARTPHLALGMGTVTSPCSVAAINLALYGRLTGVIPKCMSEVIGGWVIAIQDAAPADICRDHPRWRALLPLAAGTGREHEQERSDAVVAWMWDVLALPEVAWHIMSHAVRAAASAASAAYAAGYGARARAAWRAADPVGMLERLIAVGTVA